jgi:hypothetical protein
MYAANDGETVHVPNAEYSAALTLSSAESANAGFSLFQGSRLDLFEFIAAVGAGGMCEVYRDQDTTMKVLLPEVANDAERRALPSEVGNNSNFFTC